MTIKAKTMVFCENYEYGDVHVMTNLEASKKYAYASIADW